MVKEENKKMFNNEENDKEFRNKLNEEEKELYDLLNSKDDEVVHKVEGGIEQLNEENNFTDNFIILNTEQPYTDNNSKCKISLRFNMVVDSEDDKILLDIAKKLSSGEYELVNIEEFKKSFSKKVDEIKHGYEEAYEEFKASELERFSKEFRKAYDKFKTKLIWIFAIAGGILQTILGFINCI